MSRVTLVETDNVAVAPEDALKDVDLEKYDDDGNHGDTVEAVSDESDDVSDVCIDNDDDVVEVGGDGFVVFAVADTDIAWTVDDRDIVVAVVDWKDFDRNADVVVDSDGDVVEWIDGMGFVVNNDAGVLVVVTDDDDEDDGIMEGDGVNEHKGSDDGESGEEVVYFVTGFVRPTVWDDPVNTCLLVTVVWCA